ncbi:ribosomal protein S18 acetylase RimI-like enzyme [Salirhabdus euzebyi]|uniref:Ribosomal protein S18 acetylase RimI-like enzyme n=1 Tax=Salirhabdus euzebyi TaxID=394506 RepID=A0A841Q434_9BACI|nr:GNAT family N-acetyltransferase [Salirhabdus euzebyi]MBB6453122.1 ribosomal protein S18 acetylase RimI-like enzyme [Salirhabdus euzebyi]
MNEIKIEQVFSIKKYKDQLSNILIHIVQTGASIGFLPPLNQTDAKIYWDNVMSDEVILLIAKVNDHIVGTVQIHLCKKQNGSHRAEIAKLMTHPNYQRKGIGKLLMDEAEKVAKQYQRTLLVLDTREGDISNHLYLSLGYIEAGKIPNYSISMNGNLSATVFYYKLI